ncbi:TRAP transporter large permease [Marinobacterium arenosum]|uniref:TRAP transporter large permease n=1 Tax=Marinobacterium arenosum TaxID=2862496 RepID=UPI001C93CCCC|nr:TRAP transporter large permease [Marinobacterium arenosum]MBY4678337.1 TRAP transporter large permease [Marinobacterium arenosum]
MTTVIILLMLALLLAGFPMMMPLLIAALVGFHFVLEISPLTAIQQMISGVQPASLVAIPMFVLAADIVTRGIAANRLIDVAMAFIGHVRGGMAITSSVSCAMFGAVSGSTQATVVAVGSAMRPRMRAHGYQDSFVLALIVNASDLAYLIPPSMGMIIFGVIYGASVGELFIAGIGPGLLLVAMFSLYCYIYAVYKGIEVIPKASWRERLQSCRRAFPALMFPVITIGGIYSGVFSPTEAASVSVLYALILELFVYKSMKLRDIHETAQSTGIITAVVFVLIAAGAAFSWMISFAMIPQELLGGLNMSAMSDIEILLIISLAFFVGCMFVDPIVVMLILVPIFAPVIKASGIDPILVGVIITLQTAIGSATPPFGCDIFTAIAIFKRPYVEVVKGTPPFILMLLTVSVLLIFFPQISLFLRDLAFGY